MCSARGDIKGPEFEISFLQGDSRDPRIALGGDIFNALSLETSRLRFEFCSRLSATLHDYFSTRRDLQRFPEWESSCRFLYDSYCSIQQSMSFSIPVISTSPPDPTVHLLCSTHQVETRDQLMIQAVEAPTDIASAVFSKENLTSLCEYLAKLIVDKKSWTLLFRRGEYLLYFPNYSSLSNYSSSALSQSFVQFFRTVAFESAPFLTPTLLDWLDLVEAQLKSFW